MSPEYIRLVFEHPHCHTAVIINMPKPRDESVTVIVDRMRPSCPYCLEPLHLRSSSWGPSPPIHVPVISRDHTRIIRCTCGWQVPAGTTDSDDAITMHIAATLATKEFR